MNYRRFNRWAMILLIVCLSAIFSSCDSDGGGPTAYGRVDNQSGYFLNSVTFASHNFGIVDPEEITSYQQISPVSSRFYFTLITDTTTQCETEYLSAPVENRYYTITVTGGGLACQDFSYSVSEDSPGK